MRKLLLCVPMIILLTGCGPAQGNQGEELALSVRGEYLEMTQWRARVTLTADYGQRVYQYELEASSGPEETVLTLTAPETVAGISARLEEGESTLEYEDLCLGAGTLSSQQVSPMAALPRLMSALRDGWLLEEGQEEWNGVPCLRLTVDQSGPGDGKILSTLWLDTAGGMPLRGEIAVEGEIILTAEFTSFSFYDTIDSDSQAE